MTEDPLVPRPASTVMLVRDKRPGLARTIEVFLMRRHSAMPRPCSPSRRAASAGSRSGFLASPASVRPRRPR